MENAPRKEAKRRCPYCVKEYTPRHLTCHIGRFHPDAIAMAMRSANLRDEEELGECPPGPTALLRRRSTTLSEASDVTTSETVSPQVLDTISPQQREAYSKAAIDLLDHHESFHEEGLMTHLEKNHPMVESEHRFPLIIGATTGAQLAAKLHVLTQCAQYSPRGTRRRRVADNAACALSYWNFGMKVGTKPTDPVFRGPGSLFDEEEEPTLAQADAQRPVTSTKTRMIMPELAVPVPFEQATRDFPDELSDDELDEGPLIVDVRPSGERSVATSTSVPTTTSAMSGGIATPYTPEAKKSAVARPTVAYNPTPLEQLSSARTMTRKARSDDEESRQRSRSAGDDRAARSTTRDVLSSSEAIPSTADRAPKTRTTTATATVTSAEATERTEVQPRVSQTELYRRKTVQRHTIYSRPRRGAEPHREEDQPWRRGTNRQYMAREEPDRMYYGQHRRRN